MHKSRRATHVKRDKYQANLFHYWVEAQVSGTFEREEEEEEVEETVTREQGALTQMANMEDGPLHTDHVEEESEHEEEGEPNGNRNRNRCRKGADDGELDMEAGVNRTHRTHKSHVHGIVS